MKKVFVLAFLGCFLNTINAQENTNLTLKSDIEQKVQNLMSKMTLKEKIGQMNQYNGFWNVTGPVPK